MMTDTTTKKITKKAVEKELENAAGIAAGVPGDALVESAAIAEQQYAEHTALDFMTAKQFLKDARLIDELIEDHEEQLLRMKTKLTRTTPFYGERMGGSSSGRRRDPSDKILRFNVMEAEYCELIESLKMLKAIITDQVSAIVDDKQRKILTMRYLQHRGWQEITEALHIDRKWAWTLERRAMKEIHAPKRYWGMKKRLGLKLLSVHTDAARSVLSRKTLLFVYPFSGDSRPKVPKRA